MDFRQLKFNQDTTFLVTGGAGFIGSNLCEAILDMGYSVRCLDDLSTGKLDNIKSFISNPGFVFIEGDIRNFGTCLEACADVDYVLHHAARGNVSESIDAPLLYDDINVHGTLHMMESARQKGVKKFVYASSSAVYGDTILKRQKEGNEGKLLSPYALTKRINEEYGNLYTRLYKLDTYGLRYFNVFGKKQDYISDTAAVIPKFVTNLLNGQGPTIYGDGTQSRDFLYVDNIIDANLKACLSSQEAAGQVYNIASGESISIINLCYDLMKALKKQINPIFRNMRRGDILHSCADISKAQKSLMYNPEIDLKEGLKITIEWYLNQMK